MYFYTVSHGVWNNHVKGPMKIIERVKIAIIFLHVTSKLYQFMILNLFG